MADAIGKRCEGLMIGRRDGRPSPIVVSVAWAALGTGAAAKDLELGRYLATECLTCHRAATATSTIPNIFGLPESHFAEVIRAYREKKLPNPIMQSIAARLSDEEIESLALYFATARP
jgi:cytochrome c553